MPGSDRQILDFARAQEKQLDEQRKIQKELGRGRLSLDLFKDGDRVQVQDIKTRKWTTKGTVVSEVYHKGAQAPSLHFVDSDEGGRFLRNGKYIRLLNEQNNEAQNPDTQGTVEQLAHTSSDDSRESDDTSDKPHGNVRGYEAHQGP